MLNSSRESKILVHVPAIEWIRDMYAQIASNFIDFLKKSLIKMFICKSALSVWISEVNVLIFSVEPGNEYHKTFSYILGIVYCRSLCILFHYKFKPIGNNLDANSALFCSRFDGFKLPLKLRVNGSLSNNQKA